MTPSAPALAIALTCAGRLTPNPTATGTGDAARTSRTSRPTVDGSDARAPVTPTSDTQYRNPPLRAATHARRSGDVVGATRYTTAIPASAAAASNGAPSSGG